MERSTPKTKEERLAEALRANLRRRKPTKEASSKSVPEPSQLEL